MIDIRGSSLLEVLIACFLLALSVSVGSKALLTSIVWQGDNEKHFQSQKNL